MCVSVWVTKVPPPTGTGVPFAVQNGAPPPPGSQPSASTFPSQVNAAECHRPNVPAWPTPGSSIVYSNCGLSMLPPRGAPMLNTFVVSPLAHAARLTVPRITAASWHPVRMSVAGPASGTRLTRLAPARSSSGTAITSMKSPSAFCPARSRPTPHPELLELFEYTISRLFETPATVTVCDPQGSSTAAFKTGLTGSLMSKTCTPSQPAGTVVPRHVRGVVFFEFHDRTKMSRYTTRSP